MIKFDVVDDGYFGQVVHELRPLVEVGSVVFIALDNEKIAVGDSKTDAKVLNHAADQKRRLKSTLIHHPGRQTRRSCLAMSACDHQRSSSANKFFFDDFR